MARLLVLVIALLSFAQAETWFGNHNNSAILLRWTESDGALVGTLSGVMLDVGPNVRTYQFNMDGLRRGSVISLLVHEPRGVTETVNGQFQGRTLLLDTTAADGSITTFILQPGSTQQYNDALVAYRNVVATQQAIARDKARQAELQRKAALKKEAAVVAAQDAKLKPVGDAVDATFRRLSQLIQPGGSPLNTDEIATLQREHAPLKAILPGVQSLATTGQTNIACDSLANWVRGTRSDLAAISSIWERRRAEASRRIAELSDALQAAARQRSAWTTAVTANPKSSLRSALNLDELDHAVTDGTALLSNLKTFISQTQGTIAGLQADDEAATPWIAKYDCQYWIDHPSNIPN